MRLEFTINSNFDEEVVEVRRRRASQSKFSAAGIIGLNTTEPSYQRRQHSPRQNHIEWQHM
jgi:hypothetical protein